MTEISVEQKNSIVIISISGEITMSTVNDLDNECKRFLNSDIKVMALDLKYVQFVDSFGISRIIKISKAFIGKEIEFVLINMNDNINQIFKIATFDKLFTIMTTAEFLISYHDSK